MAPAKKAAARKKVAVKAKPHWTTAPTESSTQAREGLKVVPSLMSWVKDGVGKPNADERNLFMAAVAFAYGVWENYAEQLAIELVDHFSRELPPERVPEKARADFLKNKDAWEITVSPGWQTLWRQRVQDVALGDESEKFGLNTANRGQVENLFRLVGVEPFLDVDDEFIAGIGELVRLRGEIVHTSKVPSSLRKQHAIDWGSFVEQLVSGVDSTCRAQASSLLDAG